jgi:hypothetical protein
LYKPIEKAVYVANPNPPAAYTLFLDKEGTGSKNLYSLA